MATVFGASLSPMEREAQLLFMECYMNSSKIEALHDITNAQYERAIAEAEYTVLRTGGTYDDLDRLMMEAAEQQGEKKVGIIRTILNSIGSTISKIGNWIQRNLGANQERLNQIPDGASGEVSSYDMEVTTSGLKGLPGLINKLKNILKTINEYIRGNTKAAIATGVVTVAGIFTAIFVRGSKEEAEAKEKPPVQSNKETIIDYMRQYLKLQKEAEGAADEANKLLDKLGAPVKVWKENRERIAAKKNEKREKKAAEKAAAAAGKSDNTEEAQTESAEMYGLSAYDGLFMEANKQKECPHCHAMNPIDANYCGKCRYDFVNQKPAEDPKANTGTKTEQPKPAQPNANPQQNTGAAGTGTKSQAKTEQPKPAQPNSGTGGSQPASASKTGQPQNSGTDGKDKGEQAQQNTSEPSKPAQPNANPQPNTGTAGTGTKDNSTADQSKVESQPQDTQKTDTAQTGTNGSQPADGADQGSEGEGAEEQPVSEYSKLPWYDKAITNLQSALQVLLAGIAATGKCVLNLIATAMKWVAHKTGLDTLEDKVNNGKTGRADKKALKKAKKKIKRGVADAEAASEEIKQQQADNGEEETSESAEDDSTSGDYTTEAPDLFGIRDEYNEMMESPSIEELNSFEAIFDNL